MPNKTINLQDVFLNQVRKENVGVIIHLTNGFQLRGNVKGFDNFTVILDSAGKQMMVYKHAISTISPLQPLKMILLNKKALINFDYKVNKSFFYLLVNSK